MNEAGRQVLIDAGLRGHRQIKYRFHQSPPLTFEDWLTVDLARMIRPTFWQSGECAIGVLHLSVHSNRREAIACRRSHVMVGQPSWHECRFFALYDISDEDFTAINRLNDSEGLDFIGIARKME
jgi:hypothetical protein